MVLLMLCSLPVTWKSMGQCSLKLHEFLIRWVAVLFMLCSSPVRICKVGGVHTTEVSVTRCGRWLCLVSKECIKKLSDARKVLMEWWCFSLETWTQSKNVIACFGASRLCFVFLVPRGRDEFTWVPFAGDRQTCSWWPVNALQKPLPPITSVWSFYFDFVVNVGRCYLLVFHPFK